MFEPFQLCCSPRVKIDLGPAQAEEWPEERIATGANSRKLKPEANPGSDTESANSGSDTDSEPPADVVTPPAPPAPGRQGSPAVIELQHLAALLVSDEVDTKATQNLSVYAASPDGREACTGLLTTELMGVGQPPRRSLLPNAFAVLQELMGQLTLDAMQREASDELRTLVALSHVIVKAPLEECEECELECQECDEEDTEVDEDNRTQNLRSLYPGIEPAQHKSVRFVIDREHS